MPAETSDFLLPAPLGRTLPGELLPETSDPPLSDCLPRALPRLVPATGTPTLSSLRSDSRLGEDFVELPAEALEVSFFDCSGTVENVVRIVIISLWLVIIEPLLIFFRMVTARSVTSPCR